MNKKPNLNTSITLAVIERACDCIKAAEGWSLAMIVQALRLHETTINRHISDYLNHRKLKPDNGGSQSHLSEIQTQELIAI